jgi:hypothetical protein
MFHLVRLCCYVSGVVVVAVVLSLGLVVGCLHRYLETCICGYLDFSFLADLLITRCEPGKLRHIRDAF